VRGFRKGMSPLRAGSIALVAMIIFSWFAFTKDLPFTQTYRIQGVFENSSLLMPRMPVRVAGVDVGKVVEVGRYKDTNLAVVTMEVTDAGRPVRDDATLKIRPRLFLEGNYFVDLKPGSPNGEELDDGGVIPVAQTATPVQFHDILTSLQSDTRRSLQETLIGFGESLNSKPSAEDDADQDPDVRGLTGAESLNKALVTAVGALRGSAINGQALRGTQPRDFSRLIRGAAGVTRGLARNEEQLRTLFPNFNSAMATFASKTPQLRETVRLLGPTAVNLRKGLASVNSALPPTRAFAREILPGVRETAPTAKAWEPWFEQAIPLFGPSELGGLLKYMTPASRDLARVTHSSRAWLPKSDEFNRCISEVLIPTGNVKVDDGALSANVENYKEFWYSMVAQAGEGQGIDGNGPYLRLSAPGGSTIVTSGKTNYTGDGSLRGAATTPPLGTSPAFPNKVPPLRRDVPCHENPVPDVNGSASQGPADGSAPRAAPPQVPPRIGASSSQLLPMAALAKGAVR
jgi:phospholipid/cholesterol/gamma-HCH transport system substrate-binding protein